ncbi:MAG: hypothetical protein Q9220_004302 [cf. Caloplaca sp. 1 TL-2023]
MHSYIQLLSTPTADTAGTALILDVGKKSYLFGNLHEGLQRTCIQRNARLSKTSQVFITGKTEWKNVGGLFGLILTLADAHTASTMSAAERAGIKKKNEGSPAQIAAKAEKLAKHYAEREAAFVDAGLNPKDHIGVVEEDGDVQSTSHTLTIHGGPNLTHTLATGRRFIFRKGMPIDVKEYVRKGDGEVTENEREPDWKDDSIQVWALPIDPIQKGKSSSPSPDHRRKRSFDDYVGRNPSLERKEEATTDQLRADADLPKGDAEVRKFVVSEMFNSQWRLDALFKIPLSQVQLGATLWTRDEVTNKLERFFPPKQELLPDMEVLARRPWPGALVKELPPTKPSHTATSYIVRHYPQRGRFNPQKAKELKVHHFVFPALQRGYTVNSQDGTIVTPDMVLEPTRSGGGFALVDIPTVEYLSNLLGRAEWASSRIMEGLQAIVWNLGAGVARIPALGDFMQQNATLKHIISAPDISPNYIAYDSTSTLLTRLNRIDSQRYPIPIHDNKFPLLTSQPELDSNAPPLYEKGLRDYQLQLEPRLQIQEPPTKLPFLDTRMISETTPEEVLELATQAESEVAGMEKSVNQYIPSKDAEIICLGTGSSAPSKYRNVSATLLRVPGCGSYLFDCGEGTLGQLRRLYDPIELKVVLRDLKSIWISHMHADHHLGTASVIKAWHEAVYGPDYQFDKSNEALDKPVHLLSALRQSKKLFIFAGEHMVRWLKEYSSVEDFGYSNIVAVQTVHVGSDPQVSKMYWNDTLVGFRTKDVIM